MQETSYKHYYNFNVETVPYITFHLGNMFHFHYISGAVCMPLVLKCPRNILVIQKKSSLPVTCVTL